MGPNNNKRGQNRGKEKKERKAPKGIQKYTDCEWPHRKKKRSDWSDLISRE